MRFKWVWDSWARLGIKRNQRRNGQSWFLDTNLCANPSKENLLSTPSIKMVSWLLGEVQSLILVFFDPTFLEVLSLSTHIGGGFFILSLPPRGSRDLSWGLEKNRGAWWVFLDPTFPCLTLNVGVAVWFVFNRKWLVVVFEVVKGMREVAKEGKERIRREEKK